MKTAIALLSLLASPAMAIPVTWTEWTAVDDFTAAGTLTLGSQTVDVGLSSDFPLYFVDPGTGTDWWTGDAYTKGEVSNAPSGGDVVALGLGSVVTVTFSQPLTDIYLAYVSWNLPASIWISTPATVISEGCGYFGCGATLPDASGHGVEFVGEAHGVLKLSGKMTGFAFVGPMEVWHGLTLGVAQVPSVPLPASGGLLLGALALLARRRR